MDVDFFVLQALAAVVAAYLIGSLSFAVIVSRMMGLQDPRTYGSKNPGANAASGGDRGLVRRGRGTCSYKG